MILELDCGNSFIKWRIVISGLELTEQCQGKAKNLAELLAQLTLLDSVKISVCRLVSVRSERENQQICSGLSGLLGVEVSCAAPARQLGGVINGYADFNRLGLDRWLAMVGAFDLCRGACVVLDLGTAITVDFVNSEGAHLGGYITPGLGLLRNQLLTRTSGVRYEPFNKDVTRRASPGRATDEAVERGCLQMLRGYVGLQLFEAEKYLGSGFRVYGTGGDVALVADMPGIICVPDLVFKGLAIACPVEV